MPTDHTRNSCKYVLLLTKIVATFGHSPSIIDLYLVNRKMFSIYFMQSIYLGSLIQVKERGSFSMLWMMMAMDFSLKMNSFLVLWRTTSSNQGGSYLFVVSSDTVCVWEFLSLFISKKSDRECETLHIAQLHQFLATGSML